MKSQGKALMVLLLGSLLGTKVSATTKISLPETFWIKELNHKDHAITNQHRWIPVPNHPEWASNNEECNLSSFFTDYQTMMLGMKAVKVEGENLWIASNDSESYDLMPTTNRNKIYIKQDGNDLLVHFEQRSVLPWNGLLSGWKGLDSVEASEPSKDVWHHAPNSTSKATRRLWIRMHSIGCTPDGKGKWESDADCYIQDATGEPLFGANLKGQIFMFRLE